MTHEQNNNNSWLCYMIWAVLGVMLIMVFSFYIIYNNIGCWEKRGQFGDLFGAVNALFSGLAFAGLIITIRQQNKNLEYQQRTIDQSKKDINQQNETMKIERFENTFFKMIEVQQSLVNDLYDFDSHTERVKQDDPNGLGRISTEILTKDEYRGRNLFYYVFRRCEHDIDNPFFPDRTSVYGLYDIVRFRGKNVSIIL